MKITHINLKIALKVICFLLIALLLFMTISNCLVSIDSSDESNIHGFYHEPKDSIDVMLIGPSEISHAYSPGLAFKEYGLKSCNLAIGSVPAKLYKSMTKEIIKRQHPKLLVVNANSFFYPDVSSPDGYCLHKWIDKMPLCQNKIETIEQVSNDNLTSALICNFQKYHNNWKYPMDILKTTVSKLHANYCHGGDLKGYVAKTSVYKLSENEPVGENYILSEPAKKILSDYLTYLNKQKNIDVIFLLPPHCTAPSDESGIKEMQNMILASGFHFEDYHSNYSDTIGIDVNSDFADVEHLNVYGVQKFTNFFAKHLVEDYQIHSTCDVEEESHWKDSVEVTQEAFNLANDSIHSGRLETIDELDFTFFKKIYDQR